MLSTWYWMAIVNHGIWHRKHLVFCGNYPPNQHSPLFSIFIFKCLCSCPQLINSKLMLICCCKVFGSILWCNLPFASEVSFLCCTKSPIPWLTPLFNFENIVLSTYKMIQADFFFSNKDRFSGKPKIFRQYEKNVSYISDFYFMAVLFLVLCTFPSMSDRPF